MNPLLWGAVGLSVAFQASVVGTVRDAQNHAPLAGAVVVLNDEFRSVVADTGGRYVLENVPAGPQHLTVRHFRYRPRSLHALVPADGKLVVHVVLEPEPVPLDLYEVRAGVPVRDLERVDASGQPDRECSIAALRNHPLLAEPDVFEALGGGDVALRPELPGGAHVRGGASDQTAYALDGIPVFNPFHAAGLAGAWSPDALSRVTLTGSTPAPGSPNALSGTIEGTTRAAGARLGAQGSFTTTHSSFTFDGPLPLARTGYVVSLRSGYPGIFAPRDEPSHVMGETGDRLAKLETPAFGGTIRLLAYDSENEIDTSADRAAVDEPDPVAGRNLYAWSGQSLGAGWERELPGWTVRLLGFGAAAGASAHWRGPDGPSAVTADRRDAGFVAMAARTTGGTTTTFGLRADRSTTSYRVESDSSGLVEWALEARTPVVTAFGDHELPLGARTALALGASLAANRGDLHPAPRARVRFRPANAWTLSMSLARSHQFVQSLRNPESVVGNVFPAELFIGAGAPGVPVAHSDHAILAAEWRPTARLRLGSRAYVRDFDGLVLVAPSASGPFANGPFAHGSGTARGLALDLGLSGTRFGILASYGVQHARLTGGGTTYAPSHSATHFLEGGLTLHPSATASIRLGVAAALGRRTTPVDGSFQWEAHNLLDRGAEFVGSPNQDTGALGAAALPGYLRLDLGVRKHWHFDLGGRDVALGVFGTMTNLLGRENVLTYARDPSTGQRTRILMRPRAPLVVGLDWRF